MGKKRIAILEDDVEFRKLLTKIFQKEGFEVMSAGAGIDIVNDIVKNKPDLIILDLALPYLSGDVVIDAFHKKDVATGVPVIIVSGKEEKEIEEAVKKIGAVAYMKKPVKDINKLIELVKKHIKK